MDMKMERQVKIDLVIKMKLISDVEIETDDEKIAARAVEMLRADDPATVYVYDMPEEEKESERKSFYDSFGPKDEFKGTLFLMMTSKGMQEDPLFIFRHYKTRDLIVYPETNVFKFIKVIPLSLIQTIFEKTLGKVKEETPGGG